MNSDNRQSVHHAPNSSQLSAYDVFQLTTSENHRMRAMCGPNDARSKVSCGGTLFTKDRRLGMGDAASKVDREGDDTVEDAMYCMIQVYRPSSWSDVEEQS